jgi:hypothetical protein
MKGGYVAYSAEQAAQHLVDDIGKFDFRKMAEGTLKNPNSTG